MAGGFQFRVHDTLAARKVRLRPSTKRGKQELSLYVCGVTPYDSGHMGHAFTFCMFDILVRHAEAHGVRVRYVQNVTDVDDPLFERARRDGVDWRLLADRETAVHIRDMTALGWRPPDFMPKVSEEISRILAAATRLHRAGYTYKTDALYFEVSRFKRYGRLSHRTRASMLRKLREEGLLGTVGPDAKRDALDFPLWRESAAGEPSWPSAFGPGRPGWHIECSAMSMSLLGERFDIHTGGADNVFPHHEAEIAQSEGVTGHRVVGHWVHGQLLFLSGTRMAKSAGNFFRVTELVEQGHDPLAFRYLALQAKYRAPLNFSPDGLAGADRALRQLREKVSAWTGGAGGSRGDFAERFLAAINDDLDLPAVMALVSELTHSDLAPGTKASLLLDWDRVLGLDLDRSTAAPRALPAAAADLLARRERARAEKDFATADRLRAELAALGVHVTDGPDGQSWKVAVR